MIKNNRLVHLVLFPLLILSHSSHADEVNKKEVYSYQSKNGTPVFTDRHPVKNKQYKTQTIETNAPVPNNHTVTHYTYSTQINNIQTIVNTNEYVDKKKQYSKKKTTGKHSLKRCQRYKEKLDHYSDKMRGGYKNTEYKKLEKSRKKYKNLLFKHCDTKTFRE